MRASTTNVIVPAAARAALTALALVIPACGGVEPIGGTGESGGDEVPAEVVAAFEGSCALGGCHDATTRQGGLSLAAADLPSIIGAPSSGSPLPLVVLGDVQGSYVAVKMLPDDILSTFGLERTGARMPTTGDFTSPNNATILAWIAGAEFEGGGGETDTGESESESETGETDTTTDGMVTFDADIFPILMMKCSCHVSDPNMALNGNFSFTNDATMAYDIMVDQPSLGLPAMNFITPGDPDNSYFLHKMKGTQADVGGAGGLMPLGQSMPIPETQTIEDWIVAGAPK